jgi:large subunit ribosomal protein L3
MSGLIGIKLGMTQVFSENGSWVPVTVIECEPNVITQIKTKATDGYDALQLAIVDKKVKNTTKALVGHFSKAGTTPKRYVFEFHGEVPAGFKLGDTLSVSDVLAEGALVDIVGVSKGKGFQGTVKRHGFSGVGTRSHGQHNRERAPGSIGSNTFPARVWRGKRMAGHDGMKTVKVKNLAVVKVIKESNLVLVEGAVPGPKGRVVRIINTNRSLI